MSNMINKISRFLYELKRRKMMRVTIGYTLVLAALVGPASDILGGVGAPDWVLRTLIVILLGAFPFVLALSWIFDLTPHGFEKTPDLGRQGRHHAEPVALARSDEIDSVIAVSSVNHDWALESARKIRGTVILVQSAEDEGEFYLLRLQEESGSEVGGGREAESLASAEEPALKVVGKA